MRPRLLLNAPSELTIFYNDDNITHDSILSGNVSCSNMSALNASSIDVQLSIIRLGTFKQETRDEEKRSKNIPFAILRRNSSSNLPAFDKADTILSTALTLSSQATNPTPSRFEFTLPANLPPTTSFPTFSISYALLATSTLPWGQVLRTSQMIRISRRPVEPVPIQPTPTAYSHSPLALCVSFETPDPRGNELDAVLHLSGIHAQMLSTLAWEVEEIATITTQNAGAAPMSKALRTIDQGSCVYNPPYKQFDLGHAQPIDVPFTITVPRDTEFPSLERVDSYVLDAWSPKHARCQKMGFEVRLEQVLRIRIQLHQGKDGKGVRGGGQDVYSVVLPLRGLADGSVDDAPKKKYCIMREDV